MPNLNEKKGIEDSIIRFSYGKHILKSRYIEDLSWDEVYALFKRFLLAWGYGQKINPEKLLIMAREECGINIEDISNQALIYENFKYKVQEVRLLEYSINKHEKLMEMYDDTNTYKSILKNMLIVVGNSLHTVLSLRGAIVALHPCFDSAMTDDQRLLAVKVRNISEYLPFEMLIRYTLEYIMKLGYRRYHDDVYEKVVNEDGISTNAWKRVMEIKELVHRLVDKDENEEIWRILYANGNYTKLIGYLTDCYEYEFPDLEKDRTVFSFKNGVYLAREDKFYSFKKDKLSDNIIACKYFNKDFEDITDLQWHEIETPSFESILEYQLSEQPEYKEILRLAYILIGRMLYNTQEFDDWQVIPFFKGFAQTGKSTILKEVIKAFYDPSDVGILSNDCAENFPIENLYNKFIYIAPDINENFKLSQMTFQSMVSGESVSVARKHKTPLDMDWKPQGALAGNELFGYKDNGNSIGRRIILFEFEKALTTEQLKKDLTLELKNELPKILVKCNKAYKQAVDEWKRQNIWANIPQYFIRNRDYLLEQTNTLLQFMKSDRIEFKDHILMPKDDFVMAYNSYCKEYTIPSHKFNKDMYAAPFAICEAKQKVRVKLVKNPNINGHIKTGEYITGVQFKGQRDSEYNDNNIYNDNNNLE